MAIKKPFSKYIERALGIIIWIVKQDFFSFELHAKKRKRL